VVVGEARQRPPESTLPAIDERGGSVWEERSDDLREKCRRKVQSLSDDDTSMTDEEDTDTRARVSEALEVLFCQSRTRLHG
jgi:hypothetical protein